MERRWTGPAGLREALLKRQDVILTVFTENLMTYGLGRRVDSRDMPSVRTIVRDAAQRGNKHVGIHHGRHRQPGVSHVGRRVRRDHHARQALTQKFRA